MISVSLEPRGLIVRITRSDRILLWPEPDEVVVPAHVISGATSHPVLAAVADRSRLFASVGHGIRTVPMFPGQWVFGRRIMNGEPFYFAVRGRDTPVLVVAARRWCCSGLLVSTPHAAEIAAALAALGETEEQARLVS